MQEPLRLIFNCVWVYINWLKALQALQHGKENSTNLLLTNSIYKFRDNFINIFISFH